MAWLKIGLDEHLVNGLISHADSFSVVATTFSFSMLGFLAAVLALFSVLGQTRALKEYRRSGYLMVLLCAVAVAMAELALAFAVSMRLFIEVNSANLECAFVALIASAGMTALSVAPIIALQIRASLETP